MLLNMFKQKPQLFLGRWGYHWEITKHIQKYYD
jgi:hypothetical protein